MGTKTDEQPMSVGDLRRDLKLVLQQEANHNARITSRLGQLMERAFERIERLEAANADHSLQIRVERLETFKDDATVGLRSLERKTSHMDQSMLRLLEVRDRSATPPGARLPADPDPEPGPLNDYVRRAIGELRIAVRELSVLDGRLQNKHKVKAAITVALDYLEKFSE